MKDRFRRLYIFLFTANIRVRQRLFGLWLGNRKADLAGEDLSYLVLHDTDLRNANLRGTILRHSDLTGVDLTGADLRDADLRGAIVTRAQLAQARSLAGAILPDGTKQI